MTLWNYIFQNFFFNLLLSPFQNNESIFNLNNRLIIFLFNISLSI